MNTWTKKDTEICERAEKSGLVFNLKTGDYLTIDEMEELAKEYDKVRSKITVDEFLKGKIKSVPFKI